jgi:Peptidase M50B-like
MHSAKKRPAKKRPGQNPTSKQGTQSRQPRIIMSNPDTPAWLEDVAIASDNNSNSNNNIKNNSNSGNDYPSSSSSPTMWNRWMNLDSSASSSNRNAAIETNQNQISKKKAGLVSLEMMRSNDEITDESSSPASASALQRTKKTWGEYLGETMRRDGRFVLITIAIIICMNVPYLRWLLYPFTIFSTWIHEICHGLAAEMVGGDILKLEIFPDGSGLAYNSFTRKSGLGFVTSAGYQGTSVIGCLLLLIRRTKRGPRTGCLAISFLMMLSVLLWIRNAFGMAYGIFMGSALAGVALFLPSQHMRNVYVLLAVTCSLNAITAVRTLFGNSYMVNGQKSSTDAHTMANLKDGTTVGLWATIWLLWSIVLTMVGIVFAVPGADEVADFTICGVCQDAGCFKPCNAPGRRLLAGLFGRGAGNDDASSSDNNNNNATSAAAGGPTSSATSAV